MLRNDIDELQIGDWCFRATTGNSGSIIENSYIALRIHDGDWGLAILPILKNGEQLPIDRTIYTKPWNWNGSKELPSLTPSILHWGKGRDNPATWHGYLTDGKLVEV